MNKMVETKNKDYLIKYIEEKIKPYTLSDFEKTDVSIWINKFGLEKVIEAIDISYNNYIVIGTDGNPTSQSVDNFLSKIGGIAHNNSLSPIEQKLMHIKNICKSKFSYWNNDKATVMLNNYIKALRKNNWTDEQILEDLNTETMDVVRDSNNWSEFRAAIEGWTNSLLKDNSDSNSKSFIINNNLKIQKNYKIIKEIGSGSFGITYLVIDEGLDKYFVVKEFACEMIKEEDNKKFFKKFINEIQFLFDLHHENIVNIYDYIIDENKHIGCYIMEFIEGKNILDYIKDNRKEMCSIFIQAIKVFNYLEDKKICHRDIRINNILVTNDGILKLIDFGFVKSINDSTSIHSATQLITYPYDWPEELRNKKQKYDNKTEIYFIGQLFLDIISKLGIKKFKYIKIIKKMCVYEYGNRYSSFKDILNEVEKI